MGLETMDLRKRSINVDVENGRGIRIVKLILDSVMVMMSISMKKTARQTLRVRRNNRLFFFFARPYLSSTLSNLHLPTM